MGKLLKNLFKIIIAFAGCLLFQFIVEGILQWGYDNRSILVYFGALLLRPVLSIKIGSKVIEWIEYDIPRGIARICLKITFGYLMYVMPVACSVITFLLDL